LSFIYGRLNGAMVVHLTEIVPLPSEPPASRWPTSGDDDRRLDAGDRDLF